MSKELATPIRTIRIGSSPDADLVLADESISPMHAELAVFADSLLFLADLASQSGTYVFRHGSYERHEQGEVTSKDLVRFGEMEFSLQEILAAFSIPAAEVAGGRPAVSPRVRSWKQRLPSVREIRKHPWVVVAALVLLTGLVGWSYHSEWETYDSIESQLELARDRIQDHNADPSSKLALRALVSEAQDRAIVAQCFWSCDMKISLTEEGARLERLLTEATTSAVIGTPPS